MKNVLLFSLAFISFYYSFAIPPTPNEYSLRINSTSDIIVEATVMKKDTIDVSEEESYFLFTLEVVHILKNRNNKAEKTVQLLMRRNFDWEFGEVRGNFNNPSYLQIGDQQVFLLKENKDTISKITNGKPTYLFCDNFIDSRIQFAGSIHSTAEAYGLGLGFTTLQDLYQFIKLLPETCVPTNLTDFPQPKRLTKPYLYSQPKLEDEPVRIKTKSDSLFEKKQEILLEKYKQLQKKSPNQKLKATAVLNIKLANPTFVYGASSTSLEFDVLLSASANIYLDNLVLRLKYNTAAFGTNIYTNKGIKITKATAWGSTYNDPNVNAYDYAADIVTIPIGVVDYASLTAPRTLVTTTALKCMRVSMDIKDCNQAANIIATDIANTSILNWYLNTALGSSINSLSFSSSNNTGAINPIALCKPNITTVNPTTITAGTNSKITITGFGFGNTRGIGAVKFKNANSPILEPINTNDANDVVSWSDTKIEYIVPSVMLTVADAVSGTGAISVIENTGKESLQSNDIVEIPYSILNIIGSDSNKYSVIHAETPNGTSGKITFYATQELFNNKPYFDLVKKAINDISCATTVNLELATTPVSNSKIGILKDGISVISLANDNLFTGNATMATQRQTTQSCTKGAQKWYSSSESDIIIKRSLNWSTSFPDETLPTNEHDFYNSILHEFGHSAGLEHIIHIVGIQELMKPSLTIGERYSWTRFSYENNPFDHSIDGVQWLLAEGDKYDNIGSTCVGVKGVTRKQNCSAVTGIDSKQFANNYFALQNNPITTNEATILIGANYYDSNFNYEIINTQGQRLTSGSVLSTTKIVIPMDSLEPNLYLLNITDSNGNRKTLKVLIL